MNLWIKVVQGLMVALIPLIGFAQKTDTVTFYNGDRAVCEIKSLEQGRLQLKTVAMGTINVEWRKVSHFSSSKTFEIVLSDHSRYNGRIISIDSSRNVTLGLGIFVVETPLLDIVQLKPLHDNFFKALDGSLSAGYSFANGTQNSQLNSSGNVRYKSKKTTHSLSINYNFSENPTSSSKKQDGGYRFQYFYKKQTYTALELRWERNTELGIDSRIISNITGGYSPIENSFNVLSFEAGGSVSREFTTEGANSNNAEGLIRATYNLFIFANPKLFITVGAEVFPSVNVRGRVRTNLNGKITWEVFNNFTLDVSYWANSDNKPIDVSALTFDWGTATSIGYTF